MADFATFTAVNDTALHVAVSEWIIERYVQDALYRNGVGITELTTKDVGMGGMRVPKVKPSTGKFRKIGADTNGGWFNATQNTIIGLDEVFVEFLFQYDTPEEVPLTQQMLSLGGISNVQVRAREIGKNIAIGMNAGTMAIQLAAVINAVISAGVETNRVFTYTPATEGDSLSKILLANAALDNGDGVYHSFFPRQGRVLLLRPRAIANLRQKGSVIVGGSNFAQEILKTGALDIDVTQLPEINNGYMGMVDGVPVFKATDLLWTQAEIWLGQEAGYLDEIVGILCSHIATGRGHAFPEMTKVVDNPRGQGLIIQPLSNFGAKVFFEAGIKLIADGTFVEGAVAMTVVPEGSQE